MCCLKNSQPVLCQLFHEVLIEKLHHHVYVKNIYDDTKDNKPTGPDHTEDNHPSRYIARLLNECFVMFIILLNQELPEVDLNMILASYWREVLTSLSLLPPIPSTFTPFLPPFPVP